MHFYTLKEVLIMYEGLIMYKEGLIMYEEELATHHLTHPNEMS